MCSLSLQTAGWASNVDNLMRHSSKPPNATKRLCSKESARPSLVREALSSLKWAEKGERGFKKGETRISRPQLPHTTSKLQFGRIGMGGKWWEGGRQRQEDRGRSESSWLGLRGRVSGGQEPLGLVKSAEDRREAGSS